ncbi:MAG: FkbM family methyltransferase [Saprospiraceae bacterium]
MQVNKASLLAQLEQVAQLGRATRWQRMLYSPSRYISAMYFREVMYRFTRQPKQVTAQTFYGIPLQVALPSGMDIYLTGGKTHDSEIRLAKWMIGYISEGDTVVDVGAHYGYFTMLAAHLTGGKGQVIAFEAAPHTFDIFSQNAAPINYVKAEHAAVADQEGVLPFYEFPNQFAEYNTFHKEQFEKAPGT